MGTRNIPLGHPFGALNDALVEETAVNNGQPCFHEASKWGPRRWTHYSCAISAATSGEISGGMLGSGLQLAKKDRGDGIMVLSL